MIQGLLGKKTNQAQGFLEDGKRIPLSYVSVSGNFVSQIRTTEKEGYQSLQLAFGTKKKINKPTAGHIRKAGLEKLPRFFREIRVSELPDIQVGTEIIPADVFKPGDIVNVTGVSKGKGYAGVVKRYHFKGGPRTHGQSDRERAPGSIGQTTTPGRVYKGKKMAGRMGHEKVTIENLEIIDVTNDGVLLIKGLIPGSVNSLVVIKKVGENKKFMPLYKEIKVEDSDSHPSASDDARPASESDSSSEPASLNESQSSTLEENQEVNSGSTLDSSESAQTPVASSEQRQAPLAEDQKPEKNKEEVKEKENAK